jgi:hypothetical protein
MSAVDFHVERSEDNNRDDKKVAPCRVALRQVVKVEIDENRNECVEICHRNDRHKKIKLTAPELAWL